MDAGSRLLGGILPASLVPVCLLPEPSSPLTQGRFSHGGCMEAVLCVAFSLHWGVSPPSGCWRRGVGQMWRPAGSCPPAPPQTGQPGVNGPACAQWSFRGKASPYTPSLLRVESTEAFFSPGPPLAKNLPAPWAWHFGRFGRSST